MTCSTEPDALGRREFLHGALGAALGASALACGARARERERPNVLFLLADQLRWDALAANGGRIVATPNLDRLAGGATNFRQAICATPLCGPSRAAMLTGRLMSQHGCVFNERSDGQDGIRPEVPTFDELLAAAGYRCEYHGKWHTGGTHRAVYAAGPGEFLEEYRDEMLAKHGRPGDWRERGWRQDFYTKLPYRPFDADAALRAAMEKGIFVPHRPEVGETYLPAEDSLTAWTAGRTLRFLRSRPAQPFAVTCSFLAPHAPLIAPAPYSTMFDAREMPLPANLEDDWLLPAELRSIPDALPATPEGLGSFMALYYGLVAELDHWIGEVLRALEESGLAETTLVVFTSDHGEMLGSHRMIAKGIFFEEALRVPLLVRAPGRPGATSAACVSGRDLFATLLAEARVDAPAGPLAAQSLGELLGQAGSGGRDFAVSELNSGADRYFALRTREWKLVLPIGRPALFQLAEDPLERRELLGTGAASAAERALARDLRERLSAYLAEHGDPESAARLPAIG